MHTAKKLKYVLAITPGENSILGGLTARRAALREIARALATQFPESAEITAVGQRLEELVRHDAAGIQ